MAEWKKQFEKFLNKHKRIVSPIAIIGGFVVDIFTLNQIDQVFDNAILIVHLILVGFMIAFLFGINTPFGERVRARQYRETYRAIMLFSFGGLFSGFFLFYFRSGTFVTSAPFILLMLGLMLGAEFFKKYYHNITMRITIYFVAIFSYMIFFIPLIVNRVNAGLFILSGVVSLLLIIGFLAILRDINPYVFRHRIQKFSISILIAFGVFNGLYFLNIIPPVPLSLKFNAVYHNVERVGDFEYEATYEPSPWWRPFKKRSRIYHYTPGEPVYVFTAVFTPARLETDIHHKWQFFEDGRWHDRSDIPIHIRGGRDAGFRGFSFKQAIEPGTWRVAVTNNRSQVLGYVRFKIKKAEDDVQLILESL